MMELEVEPMTRTVDEAIKIEGKGSFRLRQQGATASVTVSNVIYDSHIPIANNTCTGGTQFSDGQWYKWVWPDGGKPTAQGGAGPSLGTPGAALEAADDNAVDYNSLKDDGDPGDTQS